MLRAIETPEAGVDSVEEIFERARAVKARLWGAQTTAVPIERVRPPVENDAPPAPPPAPTTPARVPKLIGSRPPDISHLPETEWPYQRMTSITHYVCDTYGIEFDELLSPKRSMYITPARQTAIWLIALDMPQMTLSKIARFFKRDHTTILHAISAMDAHYKRDVQGLRRRVRVR